MQPMQRRFPHSAHLGQKDVNVLIIKTSKFETPRHFGYSFNTARPSELCIHASLPVGGASNPLISITSACDEHVRHGALAQVQLLPKKISFVVLVLCLDQAHQRLQILDQRLDLALDQERHQLVQVGQTWLSVGTPIGGSDWTWSCFLFQIEILGQRVLRSLAPLWSFDFYWAAVQFLTCFLSWLLRWPRQ